MKPKPKPAPKRTVDSAPAVPEAKAPAWPAYTVERKPIAWLPPRATLGPTARSRLSNFALVAPVIDHDGNF
jgi:hypothetical protein